MPTFIRILITLSLMLIMLVTVSPAVSQSNNALNLQEDQLAITPDHPELNLSNKSFSFEVWVDTSDMILTIPVTSPSGHGDTMGYIVKKDGSYSLSLHQSNNHTSWFVLFEFYKGFAGSSAGGSGNFLSNPGWHHLKLSYELIGENHYASTFAIDGQVISSGGINRGEAPLIVDTDAPLIVGEGIVGKLDELRISSGDAVNSAVNTSSVNCMAFWQFEETDNFFDECGVNNSLKLVNIERVYLPVVLR